MLALTGSAQAATPGVNLLGALGDKALVQRAIDTGAAEVRIFVDWAAFEPNGPGDLSDKGGKPNNLHEGTFAALRQIKDAGRRVMVVITNAPAWANGAQSAAFPPTADHVADFASFAARFVRRAINEKAQVDDLEVWNEPEGSQFWLPGPDPARYTALLKATYAAVKSPDGDDRVRVFTGPTTGNNYNWIKQLYDNGAKGSFDGVSVHTDTSCLTASPDSFYREADGRLGQFTFLGYREVRAVMLAHGDDKPIAMSELGWSSTGGAPNSCARGQFAGAKPNGVDAPTQAAFLTAAYRCLANDPYVQSANWFQLSDTSTSPTDELGHYGLFDTNVSPKPALDAFKAVTAAGGGPPGPCGDFDPPAIRVIAPAPNTQYVDKLDIEAAASDTGVGLGRISFFADNASDSIVNFTANLVNDKAVALTPWFGSSKLALGKHTIKIVALDKNGNQSVQTIPVEKVKTLKATIGARFSLAKKVTCKKRRCTLTGRLQRPAGAPSLTGKVAVEWQYRNRRGKYRRLVGGTKPANKPFTFAATLKHRGRWRVRVVHRAIAPYKRVSSGYLRFRVG